VGELVAHGNAPAQRFDARSLFVGRTVPDRGITLFDVDLIEGEREKRDVPVAAGAQACDHRLVAVAGERAAVVETHCELTSHGPSSDRLSDTCNDLSIAVIPLRMRMVTIRSGSRRVAWPGR